MAEADLVQRAVDRIPRLRRISGLLKGIPARQPAFRAVDRMAAALELAVEQHRAGVLSEKSEAWLVELLDRLDKSTWNGKTSRTKNDVVRQAYFGVFPQVADSLARSLSEDTRQATLDRNRTFRNEPGAIDLSAAAEQQAPKRTPR